MAEPATAPRATRPSRADLIMVCEFMTSPKRSWGMGRDRVPSVGRPAYASAYRTELEIHPGRHITGCDPLMCRGKSCQLQQNPDTAPTRVGGSPDKRAP